MKTLKYFSLLLMAVVTSCSTDAVKPVVEDHLKGMVLVQTIENNTHITELFTSSGSLEEGYNKITLRIKDKLSGEYVSNASLDWTPTMNMASKSHSAPNSAIDKKNDSFLYDGFIVFQMPGNEDEKWSFKIDYTINGEKFNMEASLEVQASEKRRVAVFKGSNEINYVLYLVEPNKPRLAANDMVIGLASMEGPYSFPVVNDHKIHIDARMPGMGNHGAPNNNPLVQLPGEDFYQGKLNLTMSGYWKIHLQLEDPEGEIVKGEPLTESNSSSSIFLELEF